MRAAALAWAQERCQVCYSPDDLDVRHRTYARLGHELVSDLTVLCATCRGRYADRLPAPGAIPV